ncbi:hypothetical protein KSP40_PGU020509 [Platanthera guangdongensis]|uniref:Plant bHLH transcription factor ACT-like domain-containing protein n=1 Tax=Platanthera guangdongensis TaxID=2320717 RepID=A0ABR2MBF0_9ASPA
MVTGEQQQQQHKRAALHEKLQLLRSVTNSHALNTKSIIVDASKYIQSLKHKVERLNREIGYARNIIISEEENQFTRPPMVTVETVEKKGFMINVCMEKSCSGLLVSILQVFEDLGLNVVEASASCAEAFRLEAFGTQGHLASGSSAIRISPLELVVSQEEHLATIVSRKWLAAAPGGGNWLNPSRRDISPAVK